MPTHPCSTFWKCLLLLCLLPSLSQAVTRYVDNSLGDCASSYNPATRACSGGSAQSFNTVQECVSTLASAGDICYIRSGTYTEGVTVPIFVTATTTFVAGTAENPLLIAGYPDDPRPVIQTPASYSAQGIVVPYRCNLTSQGSCTATTARVPYHLRLERFEVNAINHTADLACLYIGSPNVTVDNLLLRNCSHDGIQAFSQFLTIRNSQILNCGRTQAVFSETQMKGVGTYYGNDWAFNDSNSIGGDGLFEDNIVDGCCGGGIGLQYTDTNNIIVRNNVFRNFGGTFCPWSYPGAPFLDAGTGVTIGHGGNHNNQIYNNVIYNGRSSVNESSCFTLWNDTDDHDIWNNTCYNVDVGEVRGLSGGFTINDLDIRNNIFANVTTLEQINVGGTGNVKSQNLHNPTLAATFVNAAGADFRLVVGATAINAGATIATVTTDFLGVSRPQGAGYDIGAYEFEEGGGSLPVLSATPTSLTGATVVTVTWSDLPTADANQWIGLYAVGAGTNSYLDWGWMSATNCGQTVGASSPASGECTFTVDQSPGSYEFRAYGNPSGSILHDTSETLTVSGGTVTTKPFLGLRVQ